MPTREPAEAPEEVAPDQEAAHSPRHVRDRDQDAHDPGHKRKSSADHDLDPPIEPASESRMTVEPKPTNWTTPAR